MIKSERILVVAAHPDDEVLGCGGTIARLVSEGRKVFIVILGEGMTSRFPNGNRECDKLVKALHAKSRQVAGLLGAQDVFLHGYPDNRFDTVPLLDIIKSIEGVVEKVKPGAVFTHHGGDLNIDHVIAFRATLTATRPITGCPVREIYSYEVPSSTDWSFGENWQCFRPNVFIELNEFLEIKIDALRIYDSEIRKFPHPRSPETLNAIAKKWGSMVGIGTAEAFSLIRTVY